VGFGEMEKIERSREWKKRRIPKKRAVGDVMIKGKRE